MIQLRGVSLLPAGVVLAASLLVATGVVVYQQYKDITAQPSQVLGTSAAAPVGRCTDASIMNQSIIDVDRTITLYAPDKTVTLGLGQLAKCIVVENCTEDAQACGTSSLYVKPACVAEYLNTYTIGLVTETQLSGKNTVVSLRKEDWQVNTGDLSQQIAAAIEKEVTYCQIVGQVESNKKNIGNLQVAVSNDLPSMKGTFSDHFIEVDKSRRMLFYWNDKVYQVFSIPNSVRLPTDGIYQASEVAFGDWVASIDRAYLQRTVKPEFQVVVHQ